MSNRRNFLKTAAAGSVALALQSFTSKEEHSAKPKGKTNKPIVISTWNFGVQANGAAWEILKNKTNILCFCYTYPFSSLILETIGIENIPLFCR